MMMLMLTLFVIELFLSGLLVSMLVRLAGCMSMRGVLMRMKVLMLMRMN